MTNLRYKEYQFRHNPKKLAVRYERNTAVSLCLDFGTSIQELGPGLTVIEGEGEFFGPDAMEQFQKLRKVFQEGGSGTLSGAGLEPVKAYFRELALLGKGGEQSLSYSFRFVEERAG